MSEQNHNVTHRTPDDPKTQRMKAKTTIAIGAVIAVLGFLDSCQNLFRGTPDFSWLFLGLIILGIRGVWYWTTL